MGRGKAGSQPGLPGLPTPRHLAETLLWARRAGVTMWRVMVSQHSTAEKVLPSACLSFVETNQLSWFNRSQQLSTKQPFPPPLSQWGEEEEREKKK